MSEKTRGVTLAKATPPNASPTRGRDDAINCITGEPVNTISVFDLAIQSWRESDDRQRALIAELVGALDWLLSCDVSPVESSFANEGDREYWFEKRHGLNALLAKAREESP